MSNVKIYSFDGYPMNHHTGMLLVLHVCFYYQDGKLLWEAQACNGLEQWADNFGSVVVAAPLLPESLAQTDKTTVWRDTATLSQPDRFEFVPLPYAYSPVQFLKTYRSTRQLLGSLMQRCQYLQFAIGGLAGDWAGVAALEASRQGRKYAVHADRVEHQVVKCVSKNAGILKQLYVMATVSLMARFEQHIIQQCSLGLWHGADCYNAYSPFCKASYVVHDVHTKAQDAITLSDLNEKVETAITAPTILICYAGRLSAMKAPLDWVRALGVARDLGVHFQAIWFGDGELREETRQLIAELNLTEQIHLAGLEADREKLLHKIRESQLMLFTHITPESPRCLIEALVSGTSIVGYESQYVHDLTRHKGGGSFVPVKDWQQLGQRIAELANDRAALAQLIQAAGDNGARFNDAAVFHERSELIKHHLA